MRRVFNSFILNSRILLRSYTMSSRRSARLSEVNSTISANTKSTSMDTTTEKVANVSKKRKTAPEITEPKSNGSPVTPKRKKVLKSIPPITPTPSAIGLMSIPYSSGDIDDTAPPPRSRLAIPNGTNATLVTPETHRLIATKPMDEVFPTKQVRKSTTSNILEEAQAHLIKTDPRLKPVIEKHHCHVFSPEGLAEEIDPFRSLASGIISQQVSGAAAKSIKAKFIALFNTDKPDISQHSFPTPSQVCDKSIDELRTAGLSQRKAEYILGLAEKFKSGELTTEMLFAATYEEVLDALIKVRGLGKWSVEMFACFGLKRMDVFSTGDLGVQRGMAAFEGRDVSKLKAKGGKWKYMTEKEMEEMAEPFRPYRSLFMWLMWRVEDVDISTFEA